MYARTEDFACPEGNIMIVGCYDNEGKKVTFQFARGYYYPQDSMNHIQMVLTKEFIKKHNHHPALSLEEANGLLASLFIDAIFKKVVE